MRRRIQASHVPLHLDIKFYEEAELGYRGVCFTSVAKIQRREGVR